MKKRVLILLLSGAILFSGCHKAEPQTAQPTVPGTSDYIDFQKESAGMTPESAREILANENADKRSAEYRDAVYTVNGTAAQKIIADAQTAKKETERVKSLFQDLAFRFLNGEGFESAAVRKALMKIGSWNKPYETKDLTEG